MNILRKEIIQNMSVVNRIESGDIEAKVAFASDFTGFDGHFPDNPILPGICKIQTVIAVYEQLKQQKVSLLELKQVKFFAPVLPDQELTFKIKDKKNNSGEILLSAIVTRDAEKIAKIDLLVN